jgi:hypothetical protein
MYHGQDETRCNKGKGARMRIFKEAERTEHWARDIDERLDIVLDPCGTSIPINWTGGFDPFKADRTPR